MLLLLFLLLNMGLWSKWGLGFVHCKQCKGWARPPRGRGGDPPKAKRRTGLGGRGVRWPPVHCKQCKAVHHEGMQEGGRAPMQSNCRPPQRAPSQRTPIQRQLHQLRYGVHSLTNLPFVPSRKQEERTIYAPILSGPLMSLFANPVKLVSSIFDTA
jgi:hypothetical protein